MFRLKITLLILGLIAAGAIGVNTKLGDVEDEAVGLRVQGSKHAYLMYQQVKALRDVQMKDVAVALSRSEIAVYMGVMQDFRKQLLGIEGDVYKLHGGSPTDEVAKAARAEAIRTRHAQVLDDVSGALVERLARYPRAQIASDLRDTVREGLVACLSVGVNNCVHRFAYFPLREVIAEMKPGTSLGLAPDLIVLSDAAGTGIADVDRSGWSAKGAFGDNVSIVTGVRAERVLRDVIQVPSRDDYYFATAAPIFEGGVFRGSILVGVAIDAELCAAESTILGSAVGYIENRAIIQSNFDRNDAIEVRHNLQAIVQTPGGAARVHELETDRIAAQFIPLTGNHSNLGVRAVLVTDKTQTGSAIGELRLWVWVGSIIFALVSLLLLLRWWYVFERPFINIDQGIHDITNGNRAYVFKTTSKESMWRTLVSTLNGMTAALTGRNSHHDSGAWDASLLQIEIDPVVYTEDQDEDQDAPTE